MKYFCESVASTVLKSYMIQRRWFLEVLAYGSLSTDYSFFRSTYCPEKDN